jgi:hypothetical protein
MAGEGWAVVMWSAMYGALGAAGGVGPAAVGRAVAFQLRERSRRTTMTAVLCHMPRRGGSVEVTDADGITWAVRSGGWEEDGAG